MASGSILIVDNDLDVAEVVRAILTDEGYEVSVTHEVTPDAISAAVGRLEPDCVVLDGSSEFLGYGESWSAAATLAHRERQVPVIMFTANGFDLAEGRDGETPRSREASFAAIVAKPFELDELLAAVAEASGRATRFDGSPVADAARSALLATELEAVGALDVRTSTRREWATFRTPADRLMQVYWWQAGGSYLVGRYDEDGRRMENVAHTFDRGSAVAECARYIREDNPAAA